MEGQFPHNLAQPGKAGPASKWLKVEEGRTLWTKNKNKNTGLEKVEPELLAAAANVKAKGVLQNVLYRMLSSKVSARRLAKYTTCIYYGGGGKIGANKQVLLLPFIISSWWLAHQGQA